MMKNALWKTCIGGFATAVFCVATCTQSFGAEAKSVEDMEKELNALKSSISSLTEQIESVKQEKVVSASSDTKEDVEALKNEVSTLKEEMKTANQAEQTLKAEDIAGNVYSEFAKKVKLGGQIRTRAEYANGFYQTPTNNATLGGAARPPNQANPATNAAASIDDDYVMNQTRIWADADVNEHLRVFIQLQDARVFGAEGTTVGYANPGAENSIFDLHQGYFDLKKLFDLPLTVRVGRQEIVWGDHRVIGNLVWSNQGRVFDAGRFLWDTDAIHAEVFAAKVDEHVYLGNPLTAAAAGGERDYDADESVYAAQLAFKKLIPSALLELMYIHKNDQDSRANSAISTGYAAAGDRTVQIHDIGVRLDGKVHGFDAIDYTLEGHAQFGDYAD